MKKILEFGCLLVFCLLVGASLLSAQDQPLDASANSLPAFFSDHSYDNEDVDGTKLKSTNDPSDDISAPVTTSEQKQALTDLNNKKPDRDDGL